LKKKHDEQEYLKSFEELPEKESKHFSNICRLAFQGLENSRITFTTKHLDVYGIPEDINGLGLLHITPTLSDFGKFKSLNFMHLNFQEFCAAVHISKLSKYWQYKTFMKYQDDPKFQICWQFFAGLTKLKCQQIFTSMIPASNVFSSFHKFDLIQLLLCLYEANLSDLCKQAIKFMEGNIDLSRHDMDLLSCSSLSYFIKNCTPGSIKTINLAWCGIGDKGLLYICESLILNSKSVINHHLCSLDISHNELTESGAHHITKLLSSPCVIERLNCTGNYKLGDYGVEIIVNSLMKSYVKDLRLRRTGLALKGMQAIGKVLCSKSNLETLDISENILNSDMLSCLSKSLANSSCTLTTLLLKWCNLGADEAKVLSNALKFNSTLTKLDLGYNKLGNSGIASITEALKRKQNLQMLNLNVNGITFNDACHIANLISANLNKMSDLHISGNFEEQGLAVVCKAVKNNFYLSTLDLTPFSMSVSVRPLDCLVNLFNNTYITSLHIVPPHDCSILSVAIASNCSLEELNLC